MDTQDPKTDTLDPQDWRNTIPEEIRNDPVFEKYEGPGDAYKALVSAQKFLGREHLPVPKDENDKETYGMIYDRLGRPKTPDAYPMPTDLQIPKELSLDEGMLTEFKKTAHELGILPNQFAGVYKWYMNNVIGQYNKSNEATVTAHKEAETLLRKDWGAAYQQNTALAKKVFQSFADEKAFQEFEKGAGNNPVYLRLFAKIGEVLSEDQLTGKPGGLSMTPDEAQVELRNMEGDIKGPLYDASHPQHQEFVDKRSRLTKFITG
uniref:Uncharacterized protein n=1 Tax=viral metagenome TaxID=1070528 RepID=A0A6M3K6Q0_9ZZZZ